MTRINIVPVQCLTDKHLVAEYKEITRPFNKVIKRLEAGTLQDVVIPDKYCLGKGHETFFFDKLLWLYVRRGQLRAEMLDRGFSPSDELYLSTQGVFYRKLFPIYTHWMDYSPSPEEMYLNMSRLAKRSNLPSVNQELGGE